MFRKTLTVLVLSLSIFTLTACTVSSSERQECEDKGGTVTRELYQFAGEPGHWSSTKTGNLHTCNVGNSIVEVYNEEVVELPTGVLSSPSARNQRVFNECDKLSGKTYKTFSRMGKTKMLRYACIVEGEYIQLNK